MHRFLPLAALALSLALPAAAEKPPRRPGGEPSRRVTDEQVLAWLEDRTRRPVPSDYDLAEVLPTQRAQTLLLAIRERDRLAAARPPQDQPDRVVITATRLPPEPHDQPTTNDDAATPNTGRSRGLGTGAAGIVRAITPGRSATPPPAAVTTPPPARLYEQPPDMTQEAYIASFIAEANSPAPGVADAQLGGAQGERAATSAKSLANTFESLFKPADESAGAMPGGNGAPGSPGGGKVAGMDPGQLQAAHAGGLGRPFADMGLSVGRGPDGPMIMRGDGSAASPSQLAELQRRLDSEPLAQMQRPDFYKVLPRGQLDALRASHAAAPELKNGPFKDVGATAGQRDFLWERSCAKLESGCNPNAEHGSYQKGRYVSPEDLKKMGVAAAAALEKGKGKEGDDEKRRAARELWDRIKAEDEKFRKEYEASQAANGAAPSFKGPSSGLSGLLSRLSAALGGGDEAGDAGAGQWGSSGGDGAYDAGAAGAAGYGPGGAAYGAAPGAPGTGLRTRPLPSAVPAATRRSRLMLWLCMTALAVGLAVQVRRRLAPPPDDNG